MKLLLTVVFVCLSVILKTTALSSSIEIESSEVQRDPRFINTFMHLVDSFVPNFRRKPTTPEAQSLFELRHEPSMLGLDEVHKYKDYPMEAELVASDHYVDKSIKSTKPLVYQPQIKSDYGKMSEISNDPPNSQIEVNRFQYFKPRRTQPPKLKAGRTQPPKLKTGRPQPPKLKTARIYNIPNLKSRRNKQTLNELQQGQEEMTLEPSVVRNSEQSKVNDREILSDFGQNRNKNRFKDKMKTRYRNKNRNKNSDELIGDINMRNDKIEDVPEDLQANDNTDIFVSNRKVMSVRGFKDAQKTADEKNKNVLEKRMLIASQISDDISNDINENTNDKIIKDTSLYKPIREFSIKDRYNDYGLEYDEDGNLIDQKAVESKEFINTLQTAPITKTKIDKKTKPRTKIETTDSFKKLNFWRKKFESDRLKNFLTSQKTNKSESFLPTVYPETEKKENKDDRYQTRRKDLNKIKNTRKKIKEVVSIDDELTDLKDEWKDDGWTPLKTPKKPFLKNPNIYSFSRENPRTRSRNKYRKYEPRKTTTKRTKISSSNNTEDKSDTIKYPKVNIDLTKKKERTKSSPTIPRLKSKYPKVNIDLTKVQKKTKSSATIPKLKIRYPKVNIDLTKDEKKKKIATTSPKLKIRYPKVNLDLSKIEKKDKMSTISPKLKMEIKPHDLKRKNTKVSEKFSKTESSVVEKREISNKKSSDTQTFEIEKLSNQSINITEKGEKIIDNDKMEGRTISDITEIEDEDDKIMENIKVSFNPLDDIEDAIRHIPIYLEIPGLECPKYCIRIHVEITRAGREMRLPRCRSSQLCNSKKGQEIIKNITISGEE